LTEIINKNFSKRPVSYRAGRWGFDERQKQILANFGYLADSSVTPKVNWQKNIGKPDGKGGPDFRMDSARPHIIKGRLVEVPMTILFTGVFNKENSKLSKKFLLMPDSFIKKVINRLFFRQKWLRIFSSSKLKDWKRILRSARKNNLPALVFMIHSSELMPGGSPYAKKEEDVELIYKKMEEMFYYFSKNELEGTSLGQFAMSYLSKDKL
jgi:hypothetical protein